MDFRLTPQEAAFREEVHDFIVRERPAEIDVMDLVVLRGELLARNEVYFDRMGLFGG